MSIGIYKPQFQDKTIDVPIITVEVTSGLIQFNTIMSDLANLYDGTVVVFLESKNPEGGISNWYIGRVNDDCQFLPKDQLKRKGWLKCYCNQSNAQPKVANKDIARQLTLRFCPEPKGNRIKIVVDSKPLPFSHEEVGEIEIFKLSHLLYK